MRLLDFMNCSNVVSMTLNDTYMSVHFHLILSKEWPQKQEKSTVVWATAFVT